LFSTLSKIREYGNKKEKNIIRNQSRYPRKAETGENNCPSILKPRNVY
jgi:hypothetical protein